MKLKFILLFLVCLCHRCFAQEGPVVAPVVAEKFPASIVVKLHAIISKLPVPADRHLALAQHLAKEDSLVAEAVMKGASAANIAGIRSRWQAELAGILTRQEMNSYYNRVVYENAGREARITAEFQAGKYGGLDSNRKKALYNLYFNREQQLQYSYQQFAGTPLLDRQVASVIARYDSLEIQLLHSARASQYFRNRKAVLDSIKPLTQKEASNLQGWYLYACGKNNHKSYADNFLEALHKSIRDTLYYAAWYKEEIEYQAKYNTGKTLYDLSRKYQLTTEATAALRPLIASKERAAAVIRYAFPVYSRYKDSLYNLTVNYYDSLTGIELMKDGSFPDASQFALAIKNRKRLELRPGQVDTLYGKAMMLQRMRKEQELKRPAGNFDPSSFEAEHIPAILSEEQYLQLLTIINRPQAELTAINEWTELRQRNLAEPNDSLMTVSQLTIFHTNLELVKQRFTNDKVKQYNQLWALENNAPPAMRRLKEARLADNEAAVKANQGVKASFQW